MPLLHTCLSLLFLTISVCVCVCVCVYMCVNTNLHNPTCSSHILFFLQGRWDGLWQNSLLEETCWDGDSGELAGVHCLWLRLQTVGTSKGENVPSPVNVPCGTQHHALPVAALTALVTAACSIYIFRHLSKQISNIHRINEQKIQ